MDSLLLDASAPCAAGDRTANSHTWRRRQSRKRLHQALRGQSPPRWSSADTTYAILMSRIKEAETAVAQLSLSSVVLGSKLESCASRIDMVEATCANWKLCSEEDISQLNNHVNILEDRCSDFTTSSPVQEHDCSHHRSAESGARYVSQESFDSLQDSVACLEEVSRAHINTAYERLDQLADMLVNLEITAEELTELNNATSESSKCLLPRFVALERCVDSLVSKNASSESSSSLLPRIAVLKQSVHSLGSKISSRDTDSERPFSGIQVQALNSASQLSITPMPEGLAELFQQQCNSLDARMRDIEMHQRELSSRFDDSKSTKWW